jgi:pyruvate/2-oxoacid:ferredoxin oxidoreductase beta subunit
VDVHTRCTNETPQDPKTWNERQYKEHKQTGSNVDTWNKRQYKERKQTGSDFETWNKRQYKERMRDQDRMSRSEGASLETSFTFCECFMDA